MNTFKAGDIFAFKLTEDEYLNGRIMLDVKQQCIRPGLLKSTSPLVTFDDYLLVEVYRTTSRIPTSSRSEVLIPGIFVDTSSLESNDWLITGHEDIDPTQVEFPENLIARGVRGAFLRGEIQLPVDLQIKEIMRIRAYPSKRSSRSLTEISLYLLDRKEEIDKTRFQNIEVFDLKNSDLRFSEYRSEIYRLIGEPENQSYYDMSRRLGHDINRFYQPLDSRLEIDNDGVITLCPYCMSPILEDTRGCPRCGNDTTKDARIKIDEQQYFNEARVNCKFCGGVMLKLADPCPSCRKSQR